MQDSQLCTVTLENMILGQLSLMKHTPSDTYIEKIGKNIVAALLFVKSLDDMEGRDTNRVI